MWLAIFAAMLLVSVGGAVYLVRGVHRFSFLKKLGEKHRLLSWILSAALLSLTGFFALINSWTVIVVLIHLFVFWLVCDIVAAVYRKITGRERVRNYAGAAALAFTAVYLGIGWYLAHHVVIREYSFTSPKLSGENIKAVLIADSHIGITLDGDEFAVQAERIAGLDPDIVFIAGDFVDDDTSKKDMEKACDALGQLHPRLGTYFSFGNHDKGYSDYRGYTADDVAARLEENGITVLTDECADAGDRLYIIGRKDKYEENYGSGRASMEELMRNAAGDRYTVVLDHQPNAYDEEAAAGADLVLSGHTHGGHLFPAGYIGLAFGANDRIYGTERRGSTDFLVTSGISGWAIPFKTGTVSEIVVISISGE